MKNYRIYLIRNGLTQGNLTGKYIGKTDEPLCMRGIDDLHKICNEFIYKQPDMVYTSPALRCIQTARIIYPDYDYIVAEDLRECDFGDFENKTADELAENEAFKDWIRDSANNAPPNGESAQEYTERIVKGLSGIIDTMMRTNTESVAIITHGGVIMTLLSALAYPKKPIQDWMSPGGMGYEVQTSTQLWMMGNVLEVTDYVPLKDDEPREELEYTLFDAVHDEETQE